MLDRTRHSLKISAPYTEMLLHRFEDGFSTGIKTKHVPLKYLPKSRENLPVISSLRNPKSFVLSHFKYGAWEARARKNGLEVSNPSTIQEFMSYIEYFSGKRGLFPAQFIEFHMHPALCPNPETDYGLIHWLRTEQLQTDFNNLMTQLEIQLTVNLNRTNVSSRIATPEESETISDYVHRREPLLEEIYSSVSRSLPTP